MERDGGLNVPPALTAHDLIHILHLQLFVLSRQSVVDLLEEPPLGADADDSLLHEHIEMRLLIRCQPPRFAFSDGLQDFTAAFIADLRHLAVDRLASRGGGNKHALAHKCLGRGGRLLHV